MSKKVNFKALGPLLILIIPAVILLAIFLDSHYNTNADEYQPEGTVTYSLADPEQYGLTGDEAP